VTYSIRPPIPLLYNIRCKLTRISYVKKIIFSRFCYQSHLQDLSHTQVAVCGSHSDVDKPSCFQGIWFHVLVQAAKYVPFSGEACCRQLQGCPKICSTLTMVAARLSEMLVPKYQCTICHIPEDLILRVHAIFRLSTWLQSYLVQ
jgi:hypothetical protein